MTYRLTFTFLVLESLLRFSFGQPAELDHWETLIYASDSWRYYVNASSYPQTGWQDPLYDDSSWPQGQGGFGYADGDDQTPIPSSPYPVSVHVRTTFSVSDTSQIVVALLNMDYDDGFIAWINGIEVARSNLGAPGEDPSTATPAMDHEAALYQGLVPPSIIISKEKLNECLVNGSNILVVQVNNYGSNSSDLSCLPYLSVGLSNSGMTYRPLPVWFVEPYTGFEGSHLPLVLVKTNGMPIFSEVKVLVDFGIIDNGPGNMNHLNDEWNGYKGKIGIEYRGSSSLGFPKKNFGLETRTVNGADSAVSLLGLPVEADWVLHGPYSDKSLMRNRLAYDLSSKMGHYAPRARFCEMFIDDEYQGVYVLIEKIKRDTNRVSIARLDSADVEGNDLTGGYIIKIDRSADGSYQDGWYSPYPGRGDGSRPFYAWHYPKWEDILPIQMNYIQNRITRFEESLNSINFKDPYIGYRSFIDVNSFIDYFIMAELSKNVDGYRLSTFLYKDRDDRDPLLHMGPVWDYDLAFGNADYYNASVISGWSYSTPSDGWGNPYWWSTMLLDPYYVNNLNCRWQTLREGILSDETLVAMVDAYVDTIGTASDRNFDKWLIHGLYVWPNVFVGNSYNEDVNFMKNWILSRAEWLDDNIPGSCIQTGTDNPELPSFMITVRPNPSFGQIHLEIRNPDRMQLRIEVLNITGNIVYVEDIRGDLMISRNIRLRSGIYLVRSGNGNEYQTVKAVVQ